MKSRWILFLLWFLVTSVAVGQRKLPPKSREQKAIEKQEKKDAKRKKQPDSEQRWEVGQLSAKSKGYPQISAWHNGSAGIIAPDAAEINLIAPTRIGFSKRTEWLLRIAEEPFLPNIGLKHLWGQSKRFFFSSEHTLYYVYPGLKILQKTGFKDLVSDSVKVSQGIAMRHEVILSWLINPQVWGCPHPASEKILSLKVGAELYAGFRKAKMRAFDYAHILYHSQLLENKLLYYGGLQFDSYFSHRFHYGLNGLFYSVDMKKEYAVEANLRLTCYVSRRVGFSAAAKGAYMNIGDKTQWTCIPLLDVTYWINPGRGTIQHGLYKHKRRKH